MPERRPHVAILTQYFEPEVGAAQSRLSALARELVRSGIEVSVVTALPNYPTGRIFAAYRRKLAVRENVDGVRVLRLPVYPSTGRGIQRLANYVSFSLSCVAGLLSTRRPTHLFIESPPLTLAVPGVLWARWRSADVIFNVADPWPDVAVELGVLKQGRALDAALRLEAWAYEHASLVTTPTEGVRDRLLTTKSVPADKVMMLPNGADTVRFGPDRGDPSILAELGLPSQGLLVYAGTTGYLHGLSNVIEAAALADGRGVHLAVIGGGSELEDLQRQARSLGSTNISFHEPVAPADLAKVLPLAVAGVVSLADLPSNEVVRSAKMFPVLASGRPVLHVGLGEGADLVADAGAGVVLANRDPVQIAATMEELLLHPARSDEMGAAGRAWVEDHLSWTSIVRRLIERLGIGTVEGGAAMDRDQLSETYDRYRADDVLERWSKENPGNRFLLEERLRAQEQRLGELGLADRAVDVLDVGCGGATSLPAGIRSRRRVGVDLLFERLVEIGDDSPMDGVACADGARLPFPDESFDLVILSTVLSSIDSDDIRRSVGVDIERVLRPGGCVMVYDMRLPNPSNRSIRPVRKSQVSSYFPHLAGSSTSITLIPQIARRIGDRPSLYRALARVPMLRSHRLTLLSKGLRRSS